jgi:ParB-like chromosome segregation protein Spo0J
MPRPEQLSVPQRQFDAIEFLRRSPIRGIEPTEIRDIPLDALDTDPTNPGADQYSKRYERRADAISDSFDIIGGAVYPLVVCERADAPGRYLTIDGHGRGDEAKRRGFRNVKALVYPPLTLEQRICLRETLNAAQAPFDTPLVLRDLQLLARERRLDIRNERDLRALVADLPANIRKHEEKLTLLARWPAEVADKIGIDDDDRAGVIGYDKVKELDGLVNVIRKNHPRSAAVLSSDQLYIRVLEMYRQGAFRDGRRSQDTIRDARRLLKKLPEDHPVVRQFLKGTMRFTEFKAEAEPDMEASFGRDVVSVCKALNAQLTEIDTDSLTAVERRALRRTADLALQVLAEAERR